MVKYLGMYAGVSEAIALVAAFIALFEPILIRGLPGARRRRSLRTPGVVLGATITVISLPLMVGGPSILIAGVLFILAGIAVANVGQRKDPLPKTALIIPLVPYLLLVGRVLPAFSITAFRMWNTPVDPGSAGYGAADCLAITHILLGAFCLALTITLWMRGPIGNTRLSIAASLVFLISAGLVIFSTFPRAGDEGLLLWLLIIPFFAISALVVFVTCIFNLFLADCRPKMLVVEDGKSEPFPSGRMGT